MPELPEVETTRRGIAPHITQRKITAMTLRDGRLRWPVDENLVETLPGCFIEQITRRGKYLLLHLNDKRTLLWHLGMSGSLRILSKATPPQKHDHIDLHFGATTLRFHDPRRFGALLVTDENPEHHALLNHLGPEPLSDDFNATYLFSRSRKRSIAVKKWIMDSKLVVGVGNIYANEALFAARIHPLKACGKLTRKQCELLVEKIKTVLDNAIAQGGTTLKDFVGSDGKPGYFAQQLLVYGRGGEACTACGKPLLEKALAARTTVYCNHCQR